MTDAKKYLSGLTLLDRFLFAEAVEDQEVMQLILEIILGQEIHLAGPPQTEKEARRSPQYRHIRLDVWAKDQDNRIYDTEVQNRNTGNLPRRSRYYQSYIDTTQLKPGTVDFNRLGDIIQILIAPFDLIGDGYYRYTFRMNCMENKERLLGDGAVRSFSIPEERIPRMSARNWYSCSISWSIPTIRRHPAVNVKRYRNCAGKSKISKQMKR